MIQEYLNQWQITLNTEQLNQFNQLEELLKKWNKTHNIVSDNDLNYIKERHILDSLTGLHLIKNSLNHVDMGSGMGFPLIPLAICLPQCKFTGIEPRSKRVTIINQILRELSLKNVNLVCSQAEKTNLTPQTYDSVSCRALGSLSEDWKRADFFLKPKGIFITFKGSYEVIQDKNIIKCTSSPYKTRSDSKEYYLVQILKE